MATKKKAAKAAKAKKVTRLVIVRRRWIRNEGSCASKLHRNDDHKQCCLGFYLRECGVPLAQLRDKPTPADVSGIPKQARWLTLSDKPDRNSQAAWDLMGENDSAGDEEAIARLFAEHGVKVVFR